MLLLLGSHNTDRDDTLELLFGKQVFPVLVLALELVISALNGSLLLLKLPDFFLKDFHFLSLLHRTLCLIQRADLKDIRVVPALTQCRVAEDELNWLVR